MDAFRAIEIVEGKEARDGFEAYFNNLNLTDDIRAKITVFDLTHPLYQRGFHPAFVLHMLQYNELLTNQ